MCLTPGIRVAASGCVPAWTPTVDWTSLNEAPYLATHGTEELLSDTRCDLVDGSSSP